MNTQTKPAPVDVLAAREAHNDVIADAVRLLQSPEVRAAVDSGSFAFDAGSVASRLSSTYVDFVNTDAAVAELIEAADKVCNDPESLPALRALAAALDACGVQP